MQEAPFNHSRPSTRHARRFSWVGSAHTLSAGLTGILAARSVTGGGV